MFDEKTANLILEAVNKVAYTHSGTPITPIDAKRMKILEISTDGGLPIVALQKGNMTILVMLQYSSGSILTVSNVKFVDW